MLFLILNHFINIALVFQVSSQVSQSGVRGPRGASSGRSQADMSHMILFPFSADGTTWKSYPKMTEFIQTMTQDMIGHDTELQFRTSFDGSSKGAAFIAAKHPF